MKFREWITSLKEKKKDETERILEQKVREMAEELEKMTPGTVDHARQVESLAKVAEALRNSKSLSMEMKGILLKAGIDLSGVIASTAIKVTGNKRQIESLYAISREGIAPIRKSDINML